MNSFRILGSWIVASAMTSELRTVLNDGNFNSLVLSCSACQCYMKPKQKAEQPVTNYVQWTLDSQNFVYGTSLDRPSGKKSGYALSNAEPMILPCGDIICRNCLVRKMIKKGDTRPQLGLVDPMCNIEDLEEDTFDQTVQKEEDWLIHNGNVLNIDAETSYGAMENDLSTSAHPVVCTASRLKKTRRKKSRSSTCMFDWKMSGCLPDCPGIMAMPFPATLRDMSSLPLTVPEGNFYLARRSGPVREAHPHLASGPSNRYISDACHRCRVFRFAVSVICLPNSMLPLAERERVCFLTDPDVKLDDRYLVKWEPRSKMITRHVYEDVEMTPWARPLGGKLHPEASGMRMVFRSSSLPCVCTRSEALERNGLDSRFCSLFERVVSGDLAYETYEQAMDIDFEENEPAIRGNLDDFWRHVREAALNGRFDPDGSERESDVTNVPSVRRDCYCCFCREFLQCLCAGDCDASHMARLPPMPALEAWDSIIYDGLGALANSESSDESDRSGGSNGDDDMSDPDSDMDSDDDSEGGDDFDTRPDGKERGTSTGAQIIFIASDIQMGGYDSRDNGSGPSTRPELDDEEGIYDDSD